ncbi:DNA-3-methyladenine glycosylase I [Acaricomes phytoseiuli]|uniref:DNA-3-methyladenine glycosylase I n=1 Tax=Acaricomes phytoseiuli TaxID=291968 RepID=UPI00035F2AB0|nr:DNA-3-methyladenine glycosylase I [Acaricomes phytoseiuli]MCW1249051.1 DNA-3-methyladenine glycosylase I [Acaricomes phytoseiuli]
MADDGASLATGPDGQPRCAWPGLVGSELYLRYHDEEWGRPVTGEAALFERLSLEAFQSGLSWLTILRKRDAFRAAFADFDPERVAAFGEHDVQRLLADSGIIRNRAKIEATIANARALLALPAGEPLGALLRRFQPDPRPEGAPIPAKTPESAALAKELKVRGFRFVGSTTAYAMMQAIGLVNDHEAGCWVRDAI